MKVFVQNLIVDRDMVTKISKQVWPWEVAVIQEKYGDGKVRLLDVVAVEVKGLPDAEREFHRLGLAWGADRGEGGTNLACVDMAYGRGRAGVKELKKAITASTKQKRKPAKKKVASKPAPVVEAAPEAGDPLDMG